ncbi:MAG: hypothetical protein ACO2PM_08295 [Pyrobaculum sp.]
MTCNSVNPEVRRLLQRETKIEVQIVAPGFTTILHGNGRAEVFSKSLEQLPYFSNCNIDNIVV